MEIASFLRLNLTTTVGPRALGIIDAVPTSRIYIACTRPSEDSHIAINTVIKRRSWHKFICVCVNEYSRNVLHVYAQGLSRRDCQNRHPTVFPRGSSIFSCIAMACAWQELARGRAAGSAHFNAANIDLHVRLAPTSTPHYKDIQDMGWHLCLNACL